MERRVHQKVSITDQGDARVWGKPRDNRVDADRRHADRAAFEVPVLRSLWFLSLTVILCLLGR